MCDIVKRINRIAAARSPADREREIRALKAYRRWLDTGDVASREVYFAWTLAQPSGPSKAANSKTAAPIAAMARGDLDELIKARLAGNPREDIARRLAELG